MNGSTRFISGAASAGDCRIAQFNANKACCGALLPGGGAPELLASCAVLRAASVEEGVNRMAFNAFSKALLSIPEALAQNTGADAMQILGELRHAHNKATD